MDTRKVKRTQRRASLLTSLFAAAVLIGLAGCHGEQPTAWNTSLLARTDKFFDVAHVTGDTFVVVGYNGRILRSEDAGQTWVDVDSATQWMLNHVDFAGETGWAVGHNGTVVHSRDDTPLHRLSKGIRRFCETSY